MLHSDLSGMLQSDTRQNLASKDFSMPKLAVLQWAETNNALNQLRDTLRTGRYASRKYGFRKTSKRLPVTPSMVSSMGSTWMRLPYLTSEHYIRPHI